MTGWQANRGAGVRPRPSLFVVVFLLVALGACSKSQPKATVDPTEAAQTIGSAYSLPDDQISCLRDAFAANHAATAPLGSDNTASDADLKALGQVLHGCVPVETLSVAIVGGVTEGLGGLTETQKGCLDGAIRALDDTDRDTLLVGLAVSSALDDIQRTQLGKVTNGLLVTCALSLDGASSATTAGP